MKDFLENLIKNIVDNPDEVKVEESTDETGRTVLLISVADSDMGRVIGKSGKVINAIRTIARIMAIRQGIRIRVDVKDSGRPAVEGTVEVTADSQVAEAGDDTSTNVAADQEPEEVVAPQEATPEEVTPEPEEDLILEDEVEAPTETEPKDK